MKVFIAFSIVFGIGVATIGFLFFAMGDQKSQALMRGQSLYLDNCASCHGVNLEGQNDWRNPNDDGTLPAPPHDVNGHTWHHDDMLLFEYTKLGGAGAMAARGMDNFKSAMPAFENVLTDNEINEIWLYIKSTWTDRERGVQAERTALQLEADG